MPNFDSDIPNSTARNYVPAASFSSMVRRVNLQKRYILVILTNIGFILIFAMRSNLCTFILDPVHLSTIRNYSELYFMIAFFLIQIPTAILVNRFSPFKIFGLSILCSALLGLGSLIILYISHAHWLYYVGFFRGLFEGAAFPAAHGMWQHWVPSIERSTLISIAYSGCFFGVAIGAQFSNLVCNLLPGDNILIVYGVLGILWFVLWTWSIYENPSAHPTITQDELQYLNQAINNHESTNNALNSIPWKEIFTTKSVWALYVVHFCRSFTIMYILQGDFSTLNFIHQTNVYFVEYPAFVIAITLPVVGFLADFISMKTSKSVSYIRRLYISGGLFIELLIYLPGIFIIEYVGPLFLDQIFSCFSYSCIISGFFVNHADVAPKYAHVTMTISQMMNVLATNFIYWMPIVLPFESLEDTPDYKYNKMEGYFIVATFFHIVGGLIYFVWGSGRAESWSTSETKDEENRAVSFSNNSVGV
ncbi:vesicular glutamate transporter 2-like [Chrysoperla carnea]|uniref:vesicular glutamate transporter 2-like n=1 Tax=Chrysoperla carnea TaxID=189513 RepID=UPI001D064930|nr:vesicular glutamate transporter 2-like [Chrysoperla carnea]